MPVHLRLDFKAIGVRKVIFACCRTVDNSTQGNFLSAIVGIHPTYENVKWE